MRPSPLLSHPNAVASALEDPDRVVPAHLGDPGREQVTLVKRCTVCVLAYGVVTVAGSDRLSQLTTPSSQVLAGLKPGDGGMETLLLDAQGRITHVLVAPSDSRTLWLVTEAGRDEAPTTFLDPMCFMLRVEVAEWPDVTALGTLGEGLEALVQVACDTAPDTSNSPAEAGDVEPQGLLIGLWHDS